MKVLIIDDEPMVRRSLRRLLERDGALVREAPDGQQGLDALESDSVCDVVLVDLSMPGLAGPEVVRLLRDRHPTIPLFILSGAMPEDDVAQLATGVLTKPFTADEVRRALAVCRRD